MINGWKKFNKDKRKNYKERKEKLIVFGLNS